jgi:CheY-like chemotaxis protein
VTVPPVDQSKPRVLIADDEYAIARTLEAILNQSGFLATAVNDGASAIRAAEIWQPDILLTDVIMPGLDGFQTAKHIRALLPECRIFLFSAQCSASERVCEYRAQGYDFEFIAKPVHPAELLAQLRGATLNSLSARAAQPWPALRSL